MILADKPEGWTSADVVAYLKKKYGWKKAGHAGTLDPMATGLLIILVDKETKDFDKYQNMKKTYEAEISLGAETETGDAEGKLSKITGYQDIKIKKTEIKQILKQMEGERMQVPPVYSAVKVGGVPAYKLARKGIKPKLKAKKITVYKARLIAISDQILRIKFTVSSGTYIRQLAVELGRKLGTGAYLSALRRTKIGKYKIDEAINIKS